MDGSDFADACDYASDVLDAIQEWANNPSGIKDALNCLKSADTQS